MENQQQVTPLHQPSATDRLLRAVGARGAVAPHLAGDFSAFCQRAWRVIDGSKLSWNWHHQLICEYLSLARQRKIKRLMIAVPPRSGKSRIVSVLFPAWCWTTSPHESFLCASYSASLSSELSVVRRTLLESRWFSQMWPGVVQFRPDANRMDDYANSAHGRMIATGMENVVGRGADYVLVDDPLTPAQAYSELERASAIRAFNSSLRSRLNDPEEGVIIVIQQRLHRADLIGTIQDSPEADDWTLLSLPMVAPQDEMIAFPVSGKVVQRARGDVLHPQRWSKRWCEREAEAQGPYVWNAQYLQSPSDPSQSILKPGFWRYWTYAGALDKAEGVLVRPNEFESIVIAGDLAFTKSSTSDRVALGVFGRHKGFTYLLQLEWGRMDFQETVEALRRLVRDYPNYNKIAVERAANAAALLSSLQSEIPSITLVPPQGSKQARYHGISAICARGEVVLPHPSIHRQSADLVSELEHAGVGGKWDDAADCVALGVATMAAMAGGYGPIIVAGERGDGIRALRDYLSGTEHREIDPAFGKAITDGRGLLDVTDRQVDEFLFGDLLR